MSILSHADAERHINIAGRIGRWLSERKRYAAARRDFTSLESFNDHLLRDIGIRREPFRNHRRHLMRY